MNHNDLVSIVIPVYNVAEYLPQCLESVLRQTYKNIEILVVDDGSIDSSGDICEEYALKDSRIRVTHKANEGLSAARNAGMSQSKGEWIFFIDSDDWIDTYTISRLHEFAKYYQCEMVQCNHYYAYNDHLLYRNVSRSERNLNIFTRDEGMRQLIINDRIKNFAWGKLYEAKLIKDIKFPDGKYFEDSFWQHLALHEAHKIGIIDTPLYFYRQRKNSISGVQSKKIYDLLEGNQCRLEFIKNHYPGLTNLMVNKYEELRKNILESSYGKPKYSIGGLVTKLFNKITTMGKYKKIIL